MKIEVHCDEKESLSNIDFLKTKWEKDKTKEG